MQLKNKLSHADCYLAGPIDLVEDNGVEWRMRFTKLALERNLNLNIFDPTCKPGDILSETDKEQDHIRELRDIEDWDGLRSFMKKIVRIDLKMVDKSDIIVAYVDKNVHTCGTYHEIFMASLQKKPVLLIIEGGKEHAPGWLFGIFSHEEMFDSVEETIDYLEKIDKGVYIADDRWLLVNSLNGETIDV